MSYTPSAALYASIGQTLSGLSGILEKAALHAKENDIDEEVYLSWRLTSDMFDMKRQVQIATDIAARGLARLAGAELLSLPDEETSFAQLQARIARVQELMANLDKEAIDSDMDGDITVPAGGTEMTMKRQQYVQNFILPNIFFHVTIAYALLRQCGVPIGKMDFLARP